MTVFWPEVPRYRLATKIQRLAAKRLATKFKASV